MFDHRSIPKAERERIIDRLQKWGISIDLETGKIAIPASGFFAVEMQFLQIDKVRAATYNG